MSARAIEGQVGLPGPRQHAVVAHRYLPVVGHTDGMLSVLEWCASKSVFRTEAHSPGPVTAIASTWNSIVTSGPYPPPCIAWVGTPLRSALAQPHCPPPRRRLDCEDVARLPVC